MSYEKNNSKCNKCKYTCRGLHSFTVEGRRVRRVENNIKGEKSIEQ